MFVKHVGKGVLNNGHLKMYRRTALFALIGLLVVLAGCSGILSDEDTGERVDHVPSTGEINLQAEDSTLTDSGYHRVGRIEVRTTHDRLLNNTMLCIYGQNRSVLQATSLGDLNLHNDSVAYEIDVDQRPWRVAVYHPALNEYGNLTVDVLEFRGENPGYVRHRMLAHSDDFPYSRDIPSGQCR